MSLIVNIQSHQVQVYTQQWLRRTKLEVQPLSHPDAWEPTLRTLLKTLKTPGKVSVYVGAPHVQWMVETWPSHMRNRSAFLAYLDYQANQMLPADAHATGWVVKLGARAQCGDAVPVAVMNTVFLEQIQSVLQEHHKQLQSVQPLIQEIWTQHKRSLQHTRKTTAYTGILACVEHDWLTLFGLQQGQWSSVRALRIQGKNPEAVTQHAAQYALALGMNPEAVVHLMIESQA